MKKNYTVTEARFQPKHHHKTDRLKTDSRQTQTPSDPTTGATIA
jgi:hypothetical protein